MYSYKMKKTNTTLLKPFQNTITNHRIKHVKENESTIHRQKLKQITQC
jgi:hypothetical protein